MRLRRPALAAALACGMVARYAAAQSVQGRAVTLQGGVEIPGALIALLDSTGREVARAATSPSGGFVLTAPAPGRYTLAVRQIGRQEWRSPPYALGAGSYPVTLRVEAPAFELPTITVEARRSRCGAGPGDEDVLSRLLREASLALELAQATERSVGFTVSTYERRLSPDLHTLDSTGTSLPGVARWPIQSAPPESLRVWGFVRQPPPGRTARDRESPEGPIYYGPDTRVLFTDWFLASHCFRVETADGGRLALRFEPERDERGGIAGRLLLDRKSLELTRVEFEYVGLPRWVPRHTAGGAVDLRRLPSGAWVPYAWRLMAPLPGREPGRPQLTLVGWVETGGRVTAVRRPTGEIDTAFTAELLRSRDG